MSDEQQRLQKILQGAFSGPHTPPKEYSDPQWWVSQIATQETSAALASPT
jgi:hypothetical protein